MFGSKTCSRRRKFNFAGFNSVINFLTRQFLKLSFCFFAEQKNETLSEQNIPGRLNVKNCCRDWCMHRQTKRACGRGQDLIPHVQ